jgi:hypothetical protein
MLVCLSSQSVCGCMCLDRILMLRPNTWVYIYSLFTVRLMGGHDTGSLMTGKVEIYIQYNSWTPICGDAFDQAGANVICRQLGYQIAVILGQGSYGAAERWNMIKSMHCRGDEETPLDCTIQRGRCVQDSMPASLLCRTREVAKGISDIQYKL